MATSKTLQSQWRLSSAITLSICRFAGREASAALRIALGTRPVALAAETGTFYEPFTYWDWHGVAPDETYTSENKRQRIWERERGFEIGSDRNFGYPSARQRWQQFRARIEADPGSRRMVKRIAVAHWMTVEDMTWIAGNLVSLEALDLSDIIHLPYDPSKVRHANMMDFWPNFFGELSNSMDAPPTLTMEDLDLFGHLNDPEFMATSEARTSKVDALIGFRQAYTAETWDGRRSILYALLRTLVDQQNEWDLRNKKPLSSKIKQVEERIALNHFLLGLKWLGLPDYRDRTAVPSFLLQKILPLCPDLQVLSIRGKYQSEAEPSHLSAHDHVCGFIDGITSNTPASVTVLELRLSFPYMDRLIEALKAKSAVNITQIGIDIGAWIQVYPFQVTSNELIEDLFARPARQELNQNIYHENRASDSRNIGSGDPLGNIRDCSEKEAGHDRLLRDYLTYNKVNTLPTMLYKLYGMAQNSSFDMTENPDAIMIDFFPLEPEWQVKSTDPVHPFALIQNHTLDDTHVQQATRYMPFDVNLLKDAYPWLNRTFNWRPVFDWDWFVIPNCNNLYNDLDYAFAQLIEQWGFKSDSAISVRAVQYDRLVLQVARQFRYMRESGIPVHLHLGCRDPNTSSLYWGWPYDKTAWEQWLKLPFDASLRSVSTHVDTLSVFYDLWNPLDNERLEEIDDQQPYHRPAARCPRIICPWKNTNNCLFVKQWPRNPSPTSQKMANKMSLNSANPSTLQPHVWLANNTLSGPLTGEYADEHTSDDSDTEDVGSTRTLHQLARRAAYEREAVGWQRFWAEYAPRLTNLSELHVRMPRCFDKIGSLRLGRLLDPRAGWKMTAFADERQEVQTREDIVLYTGDNSSSYKREAEYKVWPAGRFVRRSWVKIPSLSPPNSKAQHEVRRTGDVGSPRKEGVRDTSNKGNSIEDEIEKREREELDKAIARAREAAREEQELEETLQRAEKRPPPITVSDTESEPMDSAERGGAIRLQKLPDNSPEHADRPIYAFDMHDGKHAVEHIGAASITQDRHVRTEEYDSREVRMTPPKTSDNPSGSRGSEGAGESLRGTPTRAGVSMNRSAMEVESMKNTGSIGAVPTVGQRQEQDGGDGSVVRGVYVEETITIEQTFEQYIEQTIEEGDIVAANIKLELAKLDERFAQREKSPPVEQPGPMEQLDEEEQTGGVKAEIDELPIDEPTVKVSFSSELPTTPKAPSPIAESTGSKRQTTLTPESSQKTVNNPQATRAVKQKKKPSPEFDVNKSESELKPPTTKRGTPSRKTRTKKTTAPPSSDSESSSSSSSSNDSDSDSGRKKTKRRKKPTYSAEAWEEDNTSIRAKKQSTRGKASGRARGTRASSGRRGQKEAAGDEAETHAEEGDDGATGVRGGKAGSAKRRGTKRPAAAEPVSPVSKRTRLGKKKRGEV